jgi:hypothetical protein
MKKILNKFAAVDIVTILLILAWLLLKCMGINHITDYVIIGIVAYYYGQDKKEKNNG